eukprot:8315364-Alexandrium_andersonii.AAC.1
MDSRGPRAADWSGWRTAGRERRRRPRSGSRSHQPSRSVLSPSLRVGTCKCCGQPNALVARAGLGLRCEP